jgi:hypothetical protein
VFLEIPEVVAGSTTLDQGGDHYAVQRKVVHPNYDFEGDAFIDE